MGGGTAMTLFIAGLIATQSGEIPKVHQLVADTKRPCRHKSTHTT